MKKDKEIDFDALLLDLPDKEDEEEKPKKKKKRKRSKLEKKALLLTLKKGVE